MAAGEKGKPELVCKATWNSKVLGYVVIDSLVNGRACGGLRMLPDIDEAEMRGLARAMTLKYGFLGLPQGGAKAGVLGDPEAPEPDRQILLSRFASSIAPLLTQRIYVPGTDMGTTNDDIRLVLSIAGLKPKKRELQGERSGYYTALSVFTSAKQAVHHIGKRLAGCSVAIEGFGKVGSALAQLLKQADARIVAVSTSNGALFDPNGLNLDRLLDLSGLNGNRWVEDYRDAEHLSLPELLELEVDLLCPCARHHCIHETNAPQVAARIICPGANNPITPEAERALTGRGILCVPDFVANSGGVLGGTMEFASIPVRNIAAFIDHYMGMQVSWILRKSSSQGMLPRQVATTLAMERIQQIKKVGKRRSISETFFSVGLELYRRGWIPGAMISPLSIGYFKKRMTIHRSEEIEVEPVLN
jgi:glutamate dehydrogenase (NAD(P)+)